MACHYSIFVAAAVLFTIRGGYKLRWTNSKLFMLLRQQALLPARDPSDASQRGWPRELRQGLEHCLQVENRHVNTRHKSVQETEV